MKTGKPKFPSKLDIVVPVFNEAENIGPLVRRIHSTLAKAKIKFHVYVVDDHSTDKTVSQVIKLSAKYPVTLLKKQGQKGKAFSILEAAKVATAPYIAMIDADLQYPPEALPEMYTLAQELGVVVARRNDYQDSWLRRTTSRGFQWFFGKVLHKLDCDVQSGLKVFNKDIIDNVLVEDVTPWTLDIPLLTTALNMGYTIGEVQITFEKRINGESNIQLLKSIREIGGRAISYKFKAVKPFMIEPENDQSMVGAGLVRRGKKFITHTTLQPHDSALEVLTQPQKILIASLVAIILVAGLIAPLQTAIVLVATLSFVYFVDMLFNLYVILKSLHTPPEIDVKADEAAALSNKNLPIYTVLCPLYKEAHVLPHFIAAIEKMDWPKDKLDVILLLEADDQVTVDAARAMNLPKYVSIRVVPDSQPKTKPKACNYGLHYAKGEYLVIYDAEDLPDPLQLKKVYLGFQKAPESVKCIQAKLNFYNPHQNLLTRFFTAEYSLWFDVVLTGLQSIQTSLPLGGTSNHFRTAELKALQGWDPFNVTEDADLGIRLFKRGATTAIIDSITLEEANSSWRNWLRQRSRWIKGYMQTYLVHMRNPITFFRHYGLHALLFQLVMGGKISFMLINPFMWLLTLTYFGLYAWAGPTIEALYPSVIFYMAVSSLLFGNFMFIFYYMIGAAKREHWSVIKWVFLIPFYWLMVSLAAAIALYELVVKPHYWQKTVHGLHLKKEQLAKEATHVAKDISAEALTIAEAVPTIAAQTSVTAPTEGNFFSKLYGRINKYVKFREYLKRLSLKRVLSVISKPAYLAGLSYLAATLIASVLNMVVNFYLGNNLNFRDFGVFNLMMSLFYLTSIPISALGSTINYHASYLLGKHKLNSLRFFRNHIHLRVLLLAIPLTIGWLLLTPFLPGIFNTTDILPFIFFSGVWFAQLSLSVDFSYLNARLLFAQTALLVLLQPIIRLVGAVFLTQLAPGHVFVAILISLYLPALLASYFAKKGDDEYQQKHTFHLPRTYYLATVIAGLSTIAFFSLDNLVIAHLMSPEDVGKYAFIGLFGKMVFFIGGLTSTFLAPIVARKEGSGEKSLKYFHLAMISVLVLTMLGFISFIIMPMNFGYLVFGDKITAVSRYLLPYGIGIAAFTFSQVITGYHLLKKHYIFPVTALLLAGLQVVCLFLFHQTLDQVVMVMMVIGQLHLVTFSLLHVMYPRIVVPLTNVNDFFGLFQKILPNKSVKNTSGKSRILIFNWRDTKHVWAGGAEVYLHSLAKRLVAQGHSVTIFCGNDGRSARTESIDGVNIIRRGGFYTVYVWAAIYYVTRLRSSFDIVIDCENGIPFLTPLFVRKPLYLLIYHVHRDVFIKHLPKPLALIARSIEEVIMPILYRQLPILTISDSSKSEIIGLGISHPEQISIIYPGIDIPNKQSRTKTSHPSICYVGRLKAYKNVDILIKAFKSVSEKYPKAHLTIAGGGETESTLKDLVKKLELNSQVSFLGKISETDKAQLYAANWLAVQPSMIEGWGITVIEANAQGTAVIAANVNGLRDSVVNGKTGLLVPAGKIQPLAEAILMLLKDKKKLATLSKAAQIRSKNFSWDTSAEKLGQILENSTRLSSFDDKAYKLSLEETV